MNSVLTPAHASKMTPQPVWANRPDYERRVERSGDTWYVTDTATLVEDPHATVGIEWLTTIEADSATRKAESFRVCTGDDTAYVDSAQLGHVMQLVCTAALKAGVIVR